MSIVRLIVAAGIAFGVIAVLLSAVFLLVLAFQTWGGVVLLWLIAAVIFVIVWGAVYTLLDACEKFD